MLGRFIAFEGADAVGKSTQVKLTSTFLSSIDIPHIVTREPGGSPFGEHLRSLLLSTKMSPKTEALLMFAARIDHVEQTILPALERGEWVLCDRFVMSSYAYQGGGRQMGYESIRDLHKWSLDGFRPDLTILFEAPLEVGEERLQKRVLNFPTTALDKFELESKIFFARIRDMFAKVFDIEHSLFPSSMTKINADRSVEDVQLDVQHALLYYVMKHQSNNTESYK